MITKEEVYRMSQIAKISITEAELLEFTEDINDILRFVDTKDESNHKDDEFCSLHNLENVFREDNETSSITAEEALQNTMSRTGDFFSINFVNAGG